ncbi:MAG: beta-lactamase family protein [Halioglobus sp.]|nr:beta-lactamase family protein [Halioglobus sp.]
MKKLLVVVGVLLSMVAVVVLLFPNPLQRARFAATLFSGAEQYANFNRVADLFPTSTMAASPNPHEFPAGAAIELPGSFSFNGGSVDVQTFLAATDTSALLVLHDGAVVYERYQLTGGREVNWLSMSVAKSFISAGLGIAVDAGLIDIERAMSDYAPVFVGSAYDGVRVKDVLQMSSGAAWDETYSDFNSDVNRLGRVMAIGGSTTEFVAAMQREYEPGTVNRYNSGDTQALGILLRTVTGTSVAEYLERHLWHPLGMESPGYWIIDSEGVEMAFFGLNATARDYAKLGELYRNMGNWGGRRIVSADWVQASVSADAAHLQPGLDEDFPLGYGYQWWLPESDEGEYLAIGVYNQFIYVNPARDLVIVKLSAFSDYATNDTADAYREVETIEFFRAIGRALLE